MRFETRLFRETSSYVFFAYESNARQRPIADEGGDSVRRGCPAGADGKGVERGARFRAGLAKERRRSACPLRFFPSRRRREKQRRKACRQLRWAAGLAPEGSFKAPLEPVETGALDAYIQRGVIG